MDKERIDAALKTFGASINEAPEWIILIKTNGEFISRIGEYPNFYTQVIDDATATSWTYRHGRNLLETADHLMNSGLVCDVTFGDGRTFYLLHLNYTYFLGVCYHNQIASVNDTIESMFLYCHPILEAVNPSFPA